jgi:hypothetical protein
MQPTLQMHQWDLLAALASHNHLLYLRVASNLAHLGRRMQFYSL